MTGAFDDLEAEQAALAGVLRSMDDEQWHQASAATGWTVADVVLHLAVSDENVAVACRGERPALAVGTEGASVDDVVAGLVDAARGQGPSDLLERWLAAGAAAVTTLRGCADGQRLPWVVGTISARTLATTRIAEHWTHAQDITGPLGIRYPDTSRLRHVAWLGHRHLPYAFRTAGLEAGPVRCELTAPDGDIWRLGEPDAPSVIVGLASEFCRVGARRMRPEQTSLEARGPHGPAALRVLRNYAA